MRLVKHPSRLMTLLACLLLPGCMVGPDFHKPCAPPVNEFTKQPLTKTPRTASAGLPGNSQTFAYGKDIPHQWWELFHSQPLNTLIDLGIIHSPNLAAAKATLRQAQENLNAQVGSLLFPNVSLQLTGEREKIPATALSGGSAGASSSGAAAASSASGTSAAAAAASAAHPGASIFNVFNASVPVTYTLDVFGGSRRQIEVAVGQLEFQHAETLAAYLSLTSNIVTSTMRIASLEAQIAATQDLIASESSVLHIVREQFKLGGTSGLTVLTQETELGQTQATLPVLETQLTQAKDALAVLIGSFPSGTSFPHLDLAKINLPQKIPLALPSRLVRDRPDILAAEAQLHQASAQVGVATANLFPQVTLSGLIGYTNPAVGGLINSQNEAWNYMGSILTPIFNGGALLAQRRAAIDAFQAASLQYEEVVLKAFQNVADVLRALQDDARTLHYQKIAEVAAEKSLAISKEQYKLGGINYITLLIAEQQYQQTKINLVKAEEARYEDTAALFAALGGGWWDTGCPTRTL